MSTSVTRKNNTFSTNVIIPLVALNFVKRHFKLVVVQLSYFVKNLSKPKLKKIN